MKPNILVVDDHKTNLLAMKTVLSSEGYHLVLVSSGQEALKTLTRLEISLILLDVHMPGLNGFETARLIKARRKSRHIPIIFITAVQDSLGDRLRGYATGANDYIVKPIDPETLKCKVAAFLRLSEYTLQVERQSWLLRHKAEELENANEKLLETTMELRENETLARLIGLTSIDTIVTTDQYGEIYQINPAVNEMFGYCPTEVLGKPIKLLLPFVDEIPSGQTVESQARRKNGDSFPVDLQIGTGATTTKQLAVYTIRDISERKRLEKEQFDRIFQSSPCLLAIRNKDDGRFVDANDRFLETTHFDRSELLDLARNPMELRPNQPGFDDSLQEIDLQPSLRNVKVSFRTKEYKLAWGLLSTQQIMVNGEDCIFSIIMDTTKQFELEQQLLRLDRLNLIGELAGGLAHEIRNPLATLRSSLQLAQIKQREVPLDTVQILIDEIDRANSILEEFLALGRTKPAERRLDDLNRIVQTAYPLIAAEAAKNQKQVKLDLAEDCPPLKLCQKQINQLILNISLNGLEAMSANQELLIKTKKGCKEVVLSIADAGCGMSPEVLRNIWNPFFTTKRNGTGLGLPICNGIAARHNAKIEIDTSNNGTVFNVRFPIASTPKR